MTRRLLLALPIALAFAALLATTAAGDPAGPADRLAVDTGTPAPACADGPDPAPLGPRVLAPCARADAPSPGIPDCQARECPGGEAIDRSPARSGPHPPDHETGGTLEAAQAAGDCRPHPPIVINGDEGPTGFAVEDPTTGEKVPRPGSGVVAGTGTPEDPYVIEGWCIEGDNVGVFVFGFSTREGTTGIHIQNTTAHVVLRANQLTGMKTAIRLEGTENVTIEANQFDEVRKAVHAGPAVNLTVEANKISDAHKGVRVDAADGLTVQGNEIVRNRNGIHVRNADGAQVTDNVLRDIERGGLILTDTVGARLEANDLLDGPSLASRAIQLRGTQDTEVRDNVLLDYRSGLRLENTEGTLVEGNDADDNTLFAISFQDVSSVQIRDNNLSGSYDAIDAYEGDGTSEGLVIEDNTVTANGGRGLELDHGRDILVRGNTLSSNGVSGVWANGADDVRITENRIVDNDRSGVIVAHSEQVTVEDNLVRGNGWEANTRKSFRGGVGVNGAADDVVIRNNTIDDSFWHGVTVWDDEPDAPATLEANEIDGSAFVGAFVLRSTGTTVESNKLATNHVDIALERSTQAHVVDNAMDSGLAVQTETEAHHRHDVAGNTVQGQPVVYLLDAEDRKLTGPAGQIIVAGSTDVTVDGPTFENVTVPLQILHSQDTTVRGATLQAADIGVVDENSLRTRIEATRASDVLAGLLVDGSQATTVDGFETVRARFGMLASSAQAPVLEDTVVSAEEMGIWLEDTHEPELTQVTVQNASEGLSLEAVTQAQVQDLTVDGARSAVLASGGRSLNLTQARLDAETGIRLTDVDQARIEASTIAAEAIGLELDDIQAPTLVDNELDAGEADVRARNTQRLALRDNRMTTGVDLDAATLTGTDHAMPGNTVAGDPLVYQTGVEDRTIDGDAGQVLLAETSNVTLSGAGFEDVARPVQVVDSERLRLENLTVQNATVGIHLEGALDALVTGLEAEGTGVTVQADGLTASTIRESVLHGGQTALAIEDGIGNRIHNNTIQAAQTGIRLDSDQQPNHIVDNHLADNTKALELVSTGAGDEVHRNNIVGNDVGVLDDTLGGAQADARHNWWGCPDGPEDPECDDVQGDVHYDPWSNQPHDQAGAG